MNPVTMQMHNNAGATVAIRSIKACVIYDEASGAIRHHHRVLTLDGGHEPTQQEMADQALEAFRKHGNATAAKLGVLHVGADEFEPGKQYRVDHGTQTLVTLATDN